MNQDQQRPTAPDGVRRLFSEAIDCRKRGDYQQAVQILQRARGMDSTNDKILLELGYVYALDYDFTGAERCFESAMRLAPAASKNDAMMTAAHFWMDVRHFEAASKIFEQILKQDSVPLLTFVRLSEIYTRMRRLDDAAAIADRALQTYGNHEGALLTRAKVHREMKQLEDAEKLLRIVIAKPDCETDARSAAGYELGNVLDQQGCYDEAMAAFVQAKALLRPLVAPVMPVLQAKLAQMKLMQETITELMVKSWREFGQTQLQPTRKLALLCGYARSGTTLLEYVLDSHPQIISADETNVFQAKVYFSLRRGLTTSSSILSVMDSMSGRNLRQVRADYFRGIESFLGQAIGDRLLIDKNPALNFDIPAISRILPETKFLWALRDPRDVVLSCFMQPAPILPDTAPWLSLEGTMSNYAAMMNFWLALKPCLGHAAIEVRYEDIVEDLESNARRVLEFLGCPWDERVLRFDEEARGKVVRSPTFAGVSKPIYKSAVGRWKNYQKYFDPHLAKLEPFLKTFGYK